MTMTQTLAPHLPFLRRYARALTGSQSSGDAHVRAALSALLSGEQTLDTKLAPRVSLYKLFHTIWASASGHVDEEAPHGAVSGSPESRLQSLTASKRASLLLTAVEAFSLEETAAILDATPDEVEGAILDAQQTIDRQLASRVMIIEDEPIIALDLENLVTELGHKVVATAATSDEAVAKAHSERPGLILADIQLADGSSGLDAVNDLLKSFEVPVIFITAYPERFLTGERPEPAFLIAKPFQPANVSAVISQALFFQQSARRRPVPA